MISSIRLRLKSILLMMLIFIHSIDISPKDITVVVRTWKSLVNW